MVPNDADTVTVKLVYANASLIKLRGDASDNVSDLSGLAVGQLRVGLSNPSYKELAGVDSIGNPYATNAGYLNLATPRAFATKPQRLQIGRGGKGHGRGTGWTGCLTAAPPISHNKRMKTLITAQAPRPADMRHRPSSQPSR